MHKFAFLDIEFTEIPVYLHKMSNIPFILTFIFYHNRKPELQAVVKPAHVSFDRGERRLGRQKIIFDAHVGSMTAGSSGLWFSSG